MTPEKFHKTAPFVRSLVFNVIFYLSVILQMIFWLPVYFFLKRRDCWNTVRIWGISSLWFHHKIIGVTFRFEGLDNIPQQNDSSLQQGFIVASKHQSIWDIFTLLLFFKDPSYVLKRELMFIPLFGWFAAKAKVVPINRSKGGGIMAMMTNETARQLAQGHQVIIYPEGTRTAPFAQPRYKYGIAHMYNELKISVLPVVLNSGLSWPRRSFLRYPGTITMRFLPVIKPGMEPKKFRQFLEDTMEEATTELILETGAIPGKVDTGFPPGIANPKN